MGRLITSRCHDYRTRRVAVLAFFYYKLSKVEEEEVMESIDDQEAYRAYIEETPRFI